MKPTLSAILSDYGMVFVLLLLCAFFSAVTYSEQSPTGEAAARQVAGAIQQPSSARRPRVLIVVRDQPDDAAFARKLAPHLAAAGAPGRWRSSTGEPKDAREALQKTRRVGRRAGRHRLHRVHRGLARLRRSAKPTSRRSATRASVKPRSYRWPNFLKSDNLLNIANQIAVIAIVAIGMTMVIITGGIDLSVGSLIALSAVLAALFIRDYGGRRERVAGGHDRSRASRRSLLCGLVGAVLRRHDHAASASRRSSSRWR